MNIAWRWLKTHLIWKVPEKKDEQFQYNKFEDVQKYKPFKAYSDIKTLTPLQIFRKKKDTENK